MSYSNDPKVAAEHFGAFDNSSFLAHVICKMERELIRKGLNYHILTHVPEQNSDASILFSEAYCIIYLPSECEGRCEKSIRLSLGHELGYVVYKFDKLKTPKTLDNTKPLDEEEAYAWKFAYYLIGMRSGQHAENERIGRFIYGDEELKRSVAEAIKANNPKIYDELARDLDI